MDSIITILILGIAIYLGIKVFKFCVAKGRSRLISSLGAIVTWFFSYVAIMAIAQGVGLVKIPPSPPSKAAPTTVNLKDGTTVVERKVNDVKDESKAASNVAPVEVAEPRKNSQRVSDDVMAALVNDFIKPIAKVNIDDDRALVKAVDLPVVRKVTDEMDSNGEPAIQYKFRSDDQPLFDLQISRTRVLLGWLKQSDDPKDKNIDVENWRAAQRFARSLMLVEGSILITNSATGRTLTPEKEINGVQMVRSGCRSGYCELIVTR